jgi:hypothetical protein
LAVRIPAGRSRARGSRRRRSATNARLRHYGLASRAKTLADHREVPRTIVIHIERTAQGIRVQNADFDHLSLQLHSPASTMPKPEKACGQWVESAWNVASQEARAATDPALYSDMQRIDTQDAEA